MGRLLALICALVAGLALAWASQRTPPVLGADAPAGVFSATRAMADVRQIASTPHPIGSVRNAEVRDHIVSRMTALGLTPQVRRGPAGSAEGQHAQRVVFGGKVENIVGVLPGMDRAAPAVALMAHYDSVPGSPGAADDAAGVASALEVVRAIKARGIPARDVIVVITDGEEAGLLGARAFFAGDPLAKRIGMVVNMEARGGGGRVQMFQTGPEAGELVELVRQAGTRPSAASLTTFVYSLTPNDTDFSLALAAGVPGLNYAFIGRQFDYHSPTSTPSRLEQGSLQDMGQQVLATAGRAAFAPALPQPAADVIYSQAFGDLLIAYPPGVGWTLLAVAAVLICVGVVRAARLGPLPGWDVLRGAFALPAMAGTAASVLYLARKASGADFGFLGQRPLLAQAAVWEPAIMLIGLGVLLIACAELARGRLRFVMLPLLAGLGAQIGGPDPTALYIALPATVLAAVSYGWASERSAGWLGVLLGGLILAGLTTALAPAASYALAWPLLAAALAAALTGFNRHSGPVALATIAVIGAVTVGWAGGMAHLMFLALDFPAILALPIIMAGMVLWPLAQPAEGAPPERLAGRLTLLAGVVLLLIVRFGEPHDARHPRATPIAYHLDQVGRRAWRVSDVPDRDPWSDAVLRTERPKAKLRQHGQWMFTPRAVGVVAPYVEAPKPSFTLTRIAGGRLRLWVEPAGQRSVSLRLQPDQPMRLERVGGLAVDEALEPQLWTQVHWQAAQEGVELILRPAEDAGGLRLLNVEYAIRTDGWPKGAKPLPPRPPNARPFGTGDVAVLGGTVTLTW